MEAMILYFVLFFPGIFGAPFPGNIAPAPVIAFSALGELGRTLTYTIPSLALLWYIMSGGKSFSALREEKPQKQDLSSFIIGLPGLIFTGFAVSLLAMLFSRFTDMPPPPRVEAPAGFAGWLVIVFSCMGTGYLEESYFRYYLLTRLENQIPVIPLRIAFSAFLFSLCHVYEGLWGILNAALAGIFLSVLFIRYRAFHGIAWAHGVYNIVVYILGRFYEVP